MRRLGTVLVLLAACRGEDVLVQIPFEAEHRSAVVAIDHRGDVKLYSIDAARRNEQPVLQSIEGWDDQDPIVLDVSRYTETLDELGLAGPGQLFSATFGRKLPQREILERTLDQSGVGDWKESDRWPDVFADFRFGDPCRAVSAGWRMPLPADVVRIAGLVPRPDGTAMFVGRNVLERPIFFRMTTAGFERLEYAFDHRGAFAFPGIDGNIYLMGGDLNPVIYAGDPENGFRTVTETSSTALGGSWPHWSVMTESGVIFSVGPFGELYRIEGDDWSIVHRFPLVVYNDSATLTAAGPEELYVIDPDGYAIHHYVDGVVTTEQTEIDGDLVNHTDQLLVVKSIPGIGVFAASNEGTILQRGADARWRIIQTAIIIGREIWAIEPFHEGILVGGFYGVLDQFYPDTGFCEETRFRYGNTLALELLAPIDGGIAVGGFELVSENTRELFIAALVVP